MKYSSYNEFHLGDNLVVLHFLRKLAGAHPEHTFEHAVPGGDLEALREFVDLPAIQLAALPRPGAAVGRNLWKNAGEFWASHPNREDHAAFTLAWYAKLAGDWGLPAPCQTPPDLLFDFPCLSWPNLKRHAHFDFLIINSQPCSGQLRAYTTQDYLTPLIVELAREGHRVAYTQPLFLDREATPAEAEVVAAARDRLLCTRAAHLTLAGIGRLSLRCALVMGVATGPLWPCLNIWNRTKPVCALLDHVLGPEDLTTLKPHCYQVETVAAMQEWLRWWFSPAGLEQRLTP